MLEAGKNTISDIRPVRRVVSDVKPRVAMPRPQPKPQLQNVKSVPQPPEPKYTKTEVIKKDDHGKLTIAEHVQELRKRLLWSISALFVGGIIGYYYNEQIVDLLIKPLGQQLYYTSPAGGFEFLIKVCLFFGFLLSIPVLVFHLIKFVSPAIPGRIVNKTGKILIVSTCLALMGVAFAYFVSLPAALYFLNKFSEGPITSLISANSYFTFVMIYLAAFAALFQMPLILYFVNKITPLTPSMLMKKQRVVILGSFILAAVLTPTPDPLNQTLMAAPIIVLYQSSIGVVWQSNRRSPRRQKITTGKMTTAPI